MTKLHLALTLALFGLLFGLAGAGCASRVFAAPPPATITPVQTLDLVQLENDYVRDPGAADRLYAGQRWFFGLLRADQVVNSYFAVNTNEDYVQSGIVFFKPRASADIKGIIQGTTFQVSGDVQGYSAGRIVVTNCWFQVVSGGRTSTGGGY
jgi:hypothetical protein